MSPRSVFSLVLLLTLAGYVYIDTATRVIGGYVDRARAAVARAARLPAGYTLQ